MKYYLRFIFITFSSFLFWSCNIINPVEKKPTYIYIDSFQFEGNPNMGTSSHDITNVKVTFDNQTLGVFDLPANIPLIADKTGVLILTPGVSYSGLKDVQVPYDFYTIYTEDFTPSPGNTIAVHPTTGYYSDTSYNLLIEDFESSNSIVLVTGSDSLYRTKDSSEVFEGKYSGKVTVSSADYTELALSNTFTAPSETFLEINYKCTVPFLIGLQATSSTGGSDILMYLYGLKPSDEWKKAYIGLQDFIVNYPGLTYTLVIQVNPDKASEGYALFDNLKVISRK